MMKGVYLPKQVKLVQGGGSGGVREGVPCTRTREKKKNHRPQLIETNLGKARVQVLQIIRFGGQQTGKTGGIQSAEYGNKKESKDLKKEKK